MNLSMCLPPPISVSLFLNIAQQSNLKVTQMQTDMKHKHNTNWNKFLESGTPYFYDYDFANYHKCTANTLQMETQMH